MENNDGAKQQSVARLADRLRHLKAMLQQISERTELIWKIENAISLMTSDFICERILRCHLDRLPGEPESDHRDHDARRPRGSNDARRAGPLACRPGAAAAGGSNLNAAAGPPARRRPGPSDDHDTTTRRKIILILADSAPGPGSTPLAL
jgi:hypothetical protein